MGYTPNGAYVPAHVISGPSGVDDTAAFNTAIASGAGTIFVTPNPTPYIVNGVTLNNAEQELIIPRGATVQAKTGGAQSLFTVTANSVSIDGQGTIDGNHVGTTAGNAIFIDGTSNTVISGLTFINCAGIGITDRGTNSRIEVNTITNSGADAIFAAPVTTSSTDVNTTIRGNTIANTTVGAYGIRCHGNSPADLARVKVTGNDLSLPTSSTTGVGIECALLAPKSIVSGNTVFGSGIGISISGADQTTVTGNTVDSSYSYGIESASNTGVTITGNTVDGQGITNTCIEVDGSTASVDTTITGNTVRNWSGGGIVVDATGGHYDTTISANTLMAGSAAHPLILSSTSKFTVVGNVVNGAGLATSGVELSACHDGVVAHNVFDNTTAGVNTYGGTRANLVIGPNVLTGGTSTDLAAGNTLGAGSRVIRGTVAPAGCAAITVGASPFTYTNADAGTEAVYIFGGTVSQVAKNGINLFTTTNATVLLEPGESVVVTYSVAPTMVKDQK